MNTNVGCPVLKRADLSLLSSGTNSERKLVVHALDYNIVELITFATVVLRDGKLQPSQRKRVALLRREAIRARECILLLHTGIMLGKVASDMNECLQRYQTIIDGCREIISAVVPEQLGLYEAQFA